MLRNVFKIALRNLIKKRLYTAINIVGLSLGISSAIVIYGIVSFDLSFDKDHDDIESIYRLTRKDITFGKNRLDPGIPYPVRAAFKEDFPEVEYMTIVDNNSSVPVINVYETSERHKEQINNKAFVDTDYFKIFKRKFLIGDPENPFPTIRTVILSKTLAEKYFGDYTQAMGKVIGYNKDYDLTVSGVVEDAPKNTDLPIDMLMSFDLGEKHNRAWDSWISTASSVQFFIKLKKNVNASQFEDKILTYLIDHRPHEDSDKYELYLQPLSDVHHNANFQVYSGRVAPWKTIYILIIVGTLLILTASINFVNLNTAQSATRAREIGVRKILGSNKYKITLQLLGETAIVTLIATIISLGISELVLMNISYLTGFEIIKPEFTLETLVFIVSIFVTVTLLAGLYPAFVLSAFKPLKALKGKVLTDINSSFSFRKTLIVVQLFIAQVLIIAVVIISRQVDYFLEAPLGLDTEAVVEFDLPTTDSNARQRLKNELNSIPGIASTSFSNTGSISGNVWGGNFDYNNGSEIVSNDTKVKFIDSDYLSTYGIELLAGQNLRDLSPSDSTIRFLVNEEMVKAMGLSFAEQSLGEEIKVWGVKAPIAGVVKNFHAESFHESMKPIAFWARPQQFHQGAVKLHTSDLPAVIKSIKAAWEKTYPDYIFEYDFLDDEIAVMYESEERLAKMFSMFALLAITIGAIGLFGLISFVTNSRTKEIGVRKVLGASINQIVRLLSRDFILLVILAFCFAVPIAWYVGNLWLQGFEFKTEINIWVFATALAFSLLITLITVSFKSIAAAMANPVDSLRDE